MLIEFLLSNLLQTGRAGVVDTWRMPNEPERNLDNVSIHYLEADRYRGRRVCTPTDDLLLDVTDFMTLRVNPRGSDPGRLFSYGSVRNTAITLNASRAGAESGRSTIRIDPVRPVACKVTGRSRSAGDAWRQTGRLAGLAVQARIPEFDSHDPSRSFRHHTIAVQ